MLAITDEDGDGTVVFSAADGRKIVDERREELEKKGALQELEAMLTGLELALVQLKACSERQAAFRRQIAEGAEMDVLRGMLSQQNEAIANVDPVFSTRWFDDVHVSVVSIEMPDPDRPHESVTPAEAAMGRGHTHIIKWLLTEPGNQHNRTYIEAALSGMLGRQGRTAWWRLMVEIRLWRGGDPMELFEAFQHLHKNALLYILRPEEPNETPPHKMAPEDPNFCSREQCFRDLEWMLSRQHMTPRW